ncbi:hypothetical protein ESNG_03466 [Escherichia coli B093]|nr:hypothetical protein ESNG_03466 [Escherichia coli B093]
MNNEDSTRKTSTGMHLCFSPLSGKIVLARVRESKGRLRRVGNDRGVMSRMKLPAWYGRSSGLKAEKSGGKRKTAPA